MYIKDNFKEVPFHVREEPSSPFSRKFSRMFGVSPKAFLEQF